ncbi:MAG: NAD(P)-dependent glycerol-3-phosphate dehydrogenase [Deltaproteobacteria bacterium]|nr:NAD(P)-dependent glycerol-3-phosphate dehydrogenase [Deltaproteobacteria bacterium]
MNAFSGGKIAVVGGGAWGTALADLLARGGSSVELWVYEADLAEAMARERENAIYLPGHRLAEGLRPSSDLASVVSGAALVVSVSPSQMVRSVMAGAAASLAPGVPVVSASKGIEDPSLRLMHQVLEEELPGGHPVAVLSGPSFAAEVARGVPTAVSLACTDTRLGAELQAVFSGPSFRVYTLDDVVGVELAGALKNVVALAAGVCDGLGFGHNSRAALITRGLAEISRLGVALGAKPLTFLGLAGLGDLVLTCTGDLSRHRTVGVRLGRGEKLGEILGSMKAVAEGVKTCDAAVRLASRAGVEVPIIAEVWKILHREKEPRKAVEDLMGRPSKREFWDLEAAPADALG